MSALVERMVAAEVDLYVQGHIDLDDLERRVDRALHWRPPPPAPVPIPRSLAEIEQTVRLTGAERRILARWFRA